VITSNIEIDTRTTPPKDIVFQEELKDDDRGEKEGVKVTEPGMGISRAGEAGEADYEAVETGRESRSIRH
jgi:hypothetical protein